MEATGTLADTLLDDLDDLMDSDEEEEQPPQADAPPSSAGSSSGVPGMSLLTGSSSQLEDEDSKPAAVVSSELSKNPALISRVFLESRSLQKHLGRVRKRVQEKASRTTTHDTKEKQEEDHQLVVQCNKHLAALADELAHAHSALAKAYNPKFPELEELLPNYVQYKNAVRCIGNEMDLTKVNDELNEILNSNQIITISVSGSTTSGRHLTDAELAQVDDAANYVEELLQAQTELVKFVEQSMEALAPSICALIGPATAAKLLGLAGGLAELTKIPACNLQVMGQVKQNSSSRAGLSAANTKQHVGILAECDLVRSVPKQLQKKALKVVAAKLALASRVDFVNVDTGRPRSAQTGRQFRHDLEEKFEKLQEPDKAPVLKALPK
jgi:U4/U6 small nuclear ribonucleoprotein PRP31